jgi:hypothetical protein
MVGQDLVFLTFLFIRVRHMEKSALDAADIKSETFGSEVKCFVCRPSGLISTVFRM